MAEYKADEGKLKEVCSILKALLTSFGGELPMNQIEAEYSTIVGRNIPYRELKHGTLASFLQSIPGVLKLQNRGGRLVATVVNDENIDLILHQVRNQNNAKMTHKKKHIGPAARQLHAAPHPRIQGSAHWYSNTNWHTTPRTPPSMPSRPKPLLALPVQQQAQWRHRPPPSHTSLHALVSRPPPGFLSSGAYPPPRTHANTPVTHGVTAQHTSVSQSGSNKDWEKATITVNDVKAPVSEQTRGRKSYKQQLIDAVQEAEAKRGKKGHKIQLEFNTMTCGKKLDWCSVVKIGELSVSSYPNLKSTREEAEEAAAQQALQEFSKQYREKPVTPTADHSLSVSRVKKLLKEKSPNKRFWWEALQDLYREVYKEKLPQDWLAAVKDVKGLGLLFDNPCMDKWTVALAEENTNKPHNTSTQQPRDQSLQNDTSQGTTITLPGPQKPQLPPLVLPMTPTWNVVVTCVEDANNVQLVLIGKEYNVMFNELLTEMELYYMEEKNQRPAKEPVVGEVYVASHEESWFRVTLLAITGTEAKVKFVDHGDVEDIPMASLYHLHHDFFCLPPQALTCCLVGLEDAPQEAVIQALIECLPQSKNLVARVQRRQKPYAVILFDTSTNDDINLNEKVLNSLDLNMMEPTLPSLGGIAEVYLTHASTDGNLYVQIESKTYKILDDLLKIAKKRTEEMLGEKVQVDLTKLYLARYSKDGEWYRASPRTTAVDVNGKVLMRFVDFGNSEYVPLTNIRGLHKMSPILAKVPHQALACRLYNVPSNPDLRWTMQACERLIDLASPDSPLLLRVECEGTSSRPPLVHLFKRRVPQNELVSINDTLCMDTKLFGSAGDSNNNSVEKEVVVTQFRSQQSSCASGTASQSPPSELPQVGPKSFLPCSPLSINDIPDVGSYFDVFVTYSASPKHFAVQPWRMGKKYDDLAESMQNYYNNPANLKRVMAIESGQYCAHKNSNQEWYRARIERVVDGSVTGTFVDFGDCFIAQLEELQPLIPAFCTVPCLAIKAELFGIEAENIDWRPEDACRFRELTECKNFVSEVRQKKVTEDGTLFLSLLLTDTSDKILDIYIHQVLVEEGRAVFSKN